MTGLPKFHVTALASALTALLAGCSLAPTYERPAMDVPAHWQTEAHGGSASMIRSSTS